MMVRVQDENCSTPLELSTRHLGSGALKAWRAGTVSADEARTAIELAQDARAALAFVQEQPRNDPGLVCWCQRVCELAGDVDVAHTLVADFGVSPSWGIELAERLYACADAQLHGPIQNLISALQARAAAVAPAVNEDAT